MVRVDSWAKAILGALSWPIRSTNWDIEEEEGDKGEAELCRQVFKPGSPLSIETPLDAIIAQMTGAIAYRQSFFEKVWTTKDGKTTLEKLAFRKASTCQIDIDPKTNGYAGFTQRAYSPGRGFVTENFGPEKAFVYVHDGSVNPLQGESAFDAAYQNHLDKEKLLFFYYKALEKFGGPSIWAKPGTQDTQSHENLSKGIDALRQGGTLVSGSGDEIKVLETHAVGEQFKSALNYLDFQMAVSQFVQFLALADSSGSGRGSYALSRDHSDFLVIVTEGRMSEMEMAITNDPIRQLILYNFGPDAAFPRMKFQPLAEDDKQRVMEMYTNIITKTGQLPPQWIMDSLVEQVGHAIGAEKPDNATNEPAQPVAGVTGAQGGAPNQQQVQQATQALKARLGGNNG